MVATSLLIDRLDSGPSTNNFRRGIPYMKKVLVFVFAAALASSVFAQGNSSPELNADHGNSQAHVSNAAGHGGGGSNLVYHSGGRVILNAHLVMIFWGSFPS